MAQDTIFGYLTSDLVAGKTESVARILAEFSAGETPLLSAVSPNLDNLSGNHISDAYVYYDKQTTVKRSTLASALAQAATTVVLSDELAKAGEYISVDSEIILLGSTSDNKTFTGCTRAQFSTSDVAHDSGAVALLLDIPAVQGSAAGTGDATIQPAAVTTYNGIIKQEISIPGTVEAVMTNWGNGSEYARQMAEKALACKNVLEHWLIQGKATASVGQSTASLFDGLRVRLSSYTTSLSGVNGGDFQVATLEAAVKYTMDHGGEGSRDMLLLTNIRQAQIINKFGLSAIQMSPEEAQTYSQNTTKLNLGGIKLFLIPMSKLGSFAFMLSPQFIKVGPLKGREFKHTYHGQDGDRVKGMILGEYTAEIACPKAHRMWTSVSNA